MSYSFSLNRGKRNVVNIPVNSNTTGMTFSLSLTRLVGATPETVVVTDSLVANGTNVTLTVERTKVESYSGGSKYTLFGTIGGTTVELQNGSVSVEGIDSSTQGSIENPEIVATVQERIRDEFMGTTLDPALWEIVQTGPGQTITMTGSELRVDSGITVNSTTIIRSKKAWRGAYRVMFVGGATLLSQRIANQTFELRMVNAAGDSAVGYLFDGTTTTTHKMRSSNGGVAPADATASSQQSSASPGIWEIEAFIDEVYLHTKPADSTAGRLPSLVRNRQIPDPNEEVYIEIRVSNGATAPASTTRLSLDSVLVQDISELTTEITAGRGGGGVSQSLPVNVVAAITTNTRNLVDTSTPATTNHKIISAATTNGALLVGSSNTKLFGFQFTNTAATTRFVKFYNKLTAPTVGTDVPVITLAIPAGQNVNFISAVPLATMSAGLGIAITAGYLDSDTTAIGAGEVIGSVHRA